MANIVRHTHELSELDTCHYFDDFYWLITGHMWTTLVADTTPTVTVPDAVNGLVRLFTDTTNENEVAIRSTAELFKFGTNREIYGRARVQYAENDTNKANVFFGFQSAIGANSMVDAGAGMRVTGSNLVIYKLDGGTVWRVQSQCNGVQVDTVTNVTAGGTTPQVLECICKDWDGVNMEALFKIDGAFVRDANGALIKPQKVPIANATEMNIGVYVKSGGGAGGETVDVDYIYFSQNRI